MPKQKYSFTFDYLEMDEIRSYDSVVVNIFVTYNFGKEEKKSKFQYMRENTADYTQVICLEAD